MNKPQRTWTSRLTGCDAKDEMNRHGSAKWHHWVGGKVWRESAPAGGELGLKGLHVNVPIHGAIPGTISVQWGITRPSLYTADQLVSLEEPRAHCPSWPQQGVILPQPHPNNLCPCHTLSQETCQIMSWPLEREHLIFQIVFQGTSSGRWRKKPRGRCQLWGCRLCRSPRESHMQSHSALKVPQIQGLPK